MSLQKSSKKFINILLKKKGHIIIPQYKITHLIEKREEIVQEVTDYFFSTTKINIPFDKKRTKLLSQLYGTGVVEALHLILYLQRCLKLPGDICEFGVANGTTSTLLANEIKKTNKKLWLYDSFQGLSAPSKEDFLINDIFNLGSIKEYTGAMSYLPEEVMGRLKKVNFPKRKFKIVKGFIEDSSMIKDNFPKKIAFAYIDFDLYKPIKVTLSKIDLLLVKNGVIIVDDYGFFSSGVKLAVDEFVKQKKYNIVLPSYSEGHFAILSKK